MGTLPPRRGRGAGGPRPVRPCGDGRPARSQGRGHGLGVAAARRLRPRSGRAGAPARGGRLAAKRRDPRPEAAVVVQPQPPPGGRLVDRPHRQGGLAGRGRRDRPGTARPGPRGLLRLQRRHDDPPRRAAAGRRVRRAHAGLPRRPGPVLAHAPARRTGAGGAERQGAPLPGGQPLRAVLRGMLELGYGEVGEHVAQAPSGADDPDMPAPGAQVGRIIASHPVAFAVAGFALLMLVSLRSLMFAPAIAGGALGMFPVAGQHFLREFVAAFHQGGLGSATAAPPSLALLGGLATVTLDKALLAQKLLLWLALPLAAATCTRALRVLVPSLTARAVTGLLYASSPLAIGALAQGRLGELA